MTKRKLKANEKISVVVTVLFCLLLPIIFFVDIALLGQFASLDYVALHFYFLILFPLVYLSYLGLYKLFFFAGYHPRERPIEIGDQMSLAIPGFTKVTPTFSKTIAGVSNRGRKFQWLFRVVKLVIFMVLGFFGTLSFDQSNQSVAIVATFLFVFGMMATNAILTWAFQKVFHLRVVAREFNHPYFDS